MIRFSKLFFKNGVNSTREIINKISDADKTQLTDFFNDTANTLEALIINNKSKNFTLLFQTLKQLGEYYKLQKNQKRLVFIIIGYYIFLSEFFPNRNEREPLIKVIFRVITDQKSDFLIYIEHGSVLGGCSIINLDYNGKNIIWNTYTFVTPLARGRGITKEFYKYLESKKPSMIFIEVENPFSYFEDHELEDIFGEGNHYPNDNDDWIQIRGYGNDLDYFSRLMVWSKMGFKLPVYKVKHDGMKISTTYPYRQPVLGVGRKSVEDLILLFKIFDADMKLSDFSDFCNLEELIYKELNIDYQSRYSKKTKMQMISLNDKNNKFNSLAMSALRGAINFY